jgi:hypothetical protein
MNEMQTIISIEEIRSFYKEKCEETEKLFSEKHFEKFLRFCERDFFDWLKSNWNYFE